MDTDRKKNTVDNIIKNGTIKQKINLYMEDIAMRNISQDYENPFLTLTQISLTAFMISSREP